MTYYDAAEIKSKISIEQIFSLVKEYGGNPVWTPYGFISETICHNLPGRGSRKLYFYTNSNLFQCYTQCDTFDVIALVQKIHNIQLNQQLNYNEALNWLVHYFKLYDMNEDFTIVESTLSDWNNFSFYEKLEEGSDRKLDSILPEYDSSILSNFNYNVGIKPWLDEGIGPAAIKQAKIGYYPGGDKITIPHYDIENRFIGLRGRALNKLEAELYGKYKPLTINGITYSHPLSLNLYNLNNSKENIKQVKTVIIFESEKSCLKYQGYFNDISVACCGSNISNYQINLLLSLGIKEIVVAFDREGEKDDKAHYVQKFYRMNQKYGNKVLLSFVYDKKGEYLDYKDSPIDKGADVFLTLFNNRIIL